MSTEVWEMNYRLDSLEIAECTDCFALVKQGTLEAHWQWHLRMGHYNSSEELQ